MRWVPYDFTLCGVTSTDGVGTGEGQTKHLVCEVFMSIVFTYLPTQNNSATATVKRLTSLRGLNLQKDYNLLDESSISILPNRDIIFLISGLWTIFTVPFEISSDNAIPSSDDFFRLSNSRWDVCRPCRSVNIALTPSLIYVVMSPLELSCRPHPPKNYLTEVS